MGVAVSEAKSILAGPLLVFFVVFLSYFHETTNQTRMIAGTLAGPGASIETRIPEAREVLYAGIVRKADSLSNRFLEPNDSTLHERHKLRWVYKSFEAGLYRGAYAAGGAKAALYMRMLHFGVVMGIATLFLMLTLSEAWGSAPARPLFLVAVAFVAYFLFVSLGGFEEDFTPQETACAASAVYFAQKRRLIPFTLVALISALNRESGLAISLFWPLLNGFTRVSVIPVFVAGVGLLGVNYGLLSQAAFWSPKTYVSATEFERPGLFNLFRFPATLIAGSVLEILIVLSPLLFLAKDRARMSAEDWRLLSCIALYLAVLLLGTYIGNLFPYLILAPLIVTMWGKLNPPNAVLRR